MLTFLSKLPVAWRVAGALGAVLAAVVGLGVVYAKGRADGKAVIEAKVAEAVAEQERKDKELSGRLLETQRVVLDELHGRAVAELRKVNNAPITRDCGPVMRDASRGVQSVIRGGPAQP